MSRRIGDPAVKWPKQAARLVVFGRTVALQSATAKQLAEAVEPSQAGRFHERNEGRVNGPAGGRLPAQRFAAAPHSPDAHAASGEHVDGDGAVIELDNLNAFGPSAAASAQARMPLAVGATGTVELGRFSGGRCTCIDENVRLDSHRC